MSRPGTVAGRSSIEGKPKSPITAIILTLDEAANIERCIRGLSRAAEIIVVDSYSGDGTLDIVREVRPDAKVHEHRFENFGEQRNWALDHSEPTCEWVLFVDADEFCDDVLLDEIDGFIRGPGDRVGAYIAGRNYFLGRWLKHCTLYPSYQLRLLKRGRVRFRQEGHGQREIAEGPLHYLRNGWRHEAFSKGVHQWVIRHNNYSSAEVDLLLRLRAEPLSLASLWSGDAIERRRALKILGAKLPLRPLTRFIFTYFLRRGFLDGYSGFLYCCLRVAHDLHIVVKAAEQRRKGSSG